jgi:O-ureido-D-serine cyclo-ligase
LDVALATCVRLPEPDPDAAPLAVALAAAGISARALAWDDPDADFSRARLTLLRSTWNYPAQPDAFLAWAEAAARVSQLTNSIELVRWNLHKGYLLELAASGVAVVPTELVQRGSSRTLREVIGERGFSDGVVVKPAIGAASYRTIHCPPGDEARGEAHLASLLAERDALVQPYLASVEDPGERSLIWIDGAVTHAVLKQPRYAGQDESVGSIALTPSSDEVALAEAAVAAIPEAAPAPLYARIDLAYDPDGRPCVMELELIEPSLYFTQCEPALARFVAGVRERVNQSTRADCM